MKVNLNKSTPQVIPEKPEEIPVSLSTEILAAYKELGGRDYLKIMAKVKPELFMKLLMATAEQQTKVEIQDKKQNYPSIDNMEKPAILKIA